MRFLSALLIAATALVVAPVAAAGQTMKTDHGHARLGLMVMTLNDELRIHFGASADRGVLVAKVMPDTPAAAAGIEVGDVLTTVDHQPIADASDVRAALDARKAGDDVAIEVVRDKKAMTLHAKVPTSQARMQWQMLRLLPWGPALPLLPRAQT